MNTRTRKAKCVRLSGHRAGQAAVDDLHHRREVGTLEVPANTTETLRCYTVPQIERILGKSKSWVHQEVASGELKGFRVGRFVRVTQGQLDMYLKRKHDQQYGRREAVARARAYLDDAIGELSRYSNDPTIASAITQAEEASFYLDAVIEQADDDSGKAEKASMADGEHLVAAANS